MVGFARAMRARATPLPRPAGDVFDTCGTGGDGAHTFNVSTAAALRGRRRRRARRQARQSRGVEPLRQRRRVRGARRPARCAPDRVVEALEAARIAFFFAPTWHPSMRHAGPTRKELGVRTAFNLLGPLTNPAGAQRQLVGVSRPEHTELVARTLGLARRRARLGRPRRRRPRRALDARPHEGLRAGATARCNTFYVHPADVGLPTSSVADLAGGTAAENAAMIERLLDGEQRHRAATSCCSTPARRCSSPARRRRCQDGVALAAASIDSGQARAALRRAACGHGWRPR